MNTNLNFLFSVFAASILSFAIVNVRAEESATPIATPTPTTATPAASPAVPVLVPVDNNVVPHDTNVVPADADVMTTQEAVVVSKRPVAKKKKSATECSRKDLLVKNCYLQMGVNRVHIWRDKLFLNDLVARDIEPIDTVTPDKIKVTEWQFVNAKKMGSRWLLEMGFWGPPLTAGDVESLWWLVYEIKDGHFVKQVEQLIQKRKKLDNGRYRRDKLVSYGLTLDKNKIKWRAGKEKGSFK